MNRDPAGWEIGDDPTIPPDATVVATAPERSDRRAVARERWFRWLFTAGLVVFLVLALVGVFGVRTATATGAGGGYDVEVRYSRVTRPGLASPFEVRVSRTDGSWPATVQVTVSSDYLDMFDENALRPRPSSETLTDGAALWEIAPPPAGEPLVIALDARVEPGTTWRRDGTVQVLEGGQSVAEVRISTWVVP
ncbi:MAG: hypothetical protein JXA83_03070 [Acidimicrobiales bacterium]|nr:hypothetical protein [Acidimicrobiales bacterium]